LSAISVLSNLCAPIAFADINCNLNESKSKALKESHKFRFLDGASPDAPKSFGQAGVRPSKPLLMRRIFGSAGALPSRKTIRHSLIAIRCLSDLPICRLHDSLIGQLFPCPVPLVPCPFQVARQKPRTPTYIYCRNRCHIAFSFSTMIIQPANLHLSFSLSVKMVTS